MESAVRPIRDVAAFGLAICGDEEIEVWREAVLSDDLLLQYMRAVEGTSKHAFNNE